MRARSIVIGGFLGFAGLAALAIGVGTRRIEDDLARDTRRVLDRAGIAGGTIEFTGRDGTIDGIPTLPPAVLHELRTLHSLDADIHSIVQTGVLPDDPFPTNTPTPTTAAELPTGPGDATTTTSAQAPGGPTTTGVTGTGSTTGGPTTSGPEGTAAGGSNTTSPPIEPTVVTVAPPVPGGPSVDAVLANQQVVLSGTVFSAIEQLALTSSAEQVVGAGNVTSQLTIVSGDAQLGDPRVAAVVRLVQGFQRDLSAAWVTLSDGRVVAIGRLTGPDGAARVADAIAVAASQGVPIDPSGLSLPPVTTLGIAFAGPASATPTAAGTELLDRVVVGLRLAAHQTFVVGGYTDASGDPAADVALGQQRAQTVVDYLVSHGIAASRLRAVGYGATSPPAGSAAGPTGARIELTANED